MSTRLVLPWVAASVLLGCTSASPPQLSRGSGSSVSAAKPVAKPVVLDAQLSSARRLDEQALQLAQAGQLEEAVLTWDRALALAPEAAKLHNNRGYALILLGRLDDARVALERAATLQFPSVQAPANLALLARLQQQHLTKPLEPIQEAMTVAASNSGVSDAADTLQDHGPKLVVIGPQIYELRDAPAGLGRQLPPIHTVAKVSVKDVAQHQDTALAAIKAARLEVSNGVGVRFLAKRTSIKLAEQGVATHRLTNTPGFAQAVTELQFPPSQDRAAQALWALLPAGAVLKAQTQVDHLRLVLGHDVAGRAVVAWLDGVPAQPVEQMTDVAVSVSVSVLKPLPDGWQWL